MKRKTIEPAGQTKFTCQVCKRNFKLVGNGGWLANHGYTNDTYGQKGTCLGSGFKPEGSLEGAIRRTEHGIAWDKKRESFAWRVQQGEDTLAWLKTR